MANLAELLGADIEAVRHRIDSDFRIGYQLHNHFFGVLAGKTIVIWGLSFKPQTGDMREAPARELMEALWQVNANMQAYDPKAMEECQRIYGTSDDLTLEGTK